MTSIESVSRFVAAGPWFEVSSEALIVFEPASGRVVDANPEALRLTDYTAAAIRTLTLDRLLKGPAAGTEDLERLRRVGQSGGGVVVATEGVFLRGRHGRSVAVSLRASRARGGDEPLGLIALSTPSSSPSSSPGSALTDFPASDPEAFERLFPLTSDLCCVIGPDGQFLWVNRAWEDALGYPAEELLQGPIARFLHPDDHDRPGPAAPSRFESRFRQRDGGERRLAWRALVVGGLFYGSARDVTPSQTQGQGQGDDLAVRAKAEFLANMSHEIRTPLTAILGFTELVMERFQSASAAAIDPECLEHLRAVHRNGQVLLGLVGDVLDFTHLESGSAPVQLAPCSPGQVLAEVVAALRTRSIGKGLTLDVEHQTPLPVSLRTDATRLRQILIQVVGNAVKYTERGGVRLAVRLEPGSESGSGPGPRLVVEVSDTGIGMSPDELSRVFQPFYRADTSWRRVQGGAGLGLAISRRLADQLGGSLDARSTLGLGSLFTLTLPTSPAEAALVVRPVAEATAAPRALDAPRILVADDNLDNQRVVSIRLTMAGARVELAPNGQIALEMALAAREAGQPFALILMDMQMPVLDGYEATRLLRIEGIRSPIVALTAHATPEDRLECLHFGCDDHVGKPIDWSALLDLIHRLLATTGA